MNNSVSQKTTEEVLEEGVVECVKCFCKDQEVSLELIMGRSSVTSFRACREEYGVGGPTETDGEVGGS